MHFSHSHNGNGSKTTKFMLVAGLHVVLGTLLVHGLHTRHLSLPRLPEDLTVTLEPTRPEPPVPVDPPKPVKQLAPPPIVVPIQEVAVAPPPDAPPLVTTTRSEPAQPPVTPGVAVADTAPAAKPVANPGQMHSAVFADANSCALPSYPASAAREGETGTTTLALLVGTDGRVSSARVQQTSGSRTLDRAALSALSLCKFKPAMNNGVPEAGWAQMAYVWTLD
jgi:protein TonB